MPLHSQVSVLTRPAAGAVNASTLRTLLTALLLSGVLAMAAFCAGTHSDLSAIGAHAEPSAQHLSAAVPEEEPEQHEEPHSEVSCLQGAVLRAVQTVDEPFLAVAVPTALGIGTVVAAAREPTLRRSARRRRPMRSGRATLVAICRWRI